MIFEPVSDIYYFTCDKEKQILVCTLHEPITEELTSKWKSRAAAVCTMVDLKQIDGLFRDIAYNPHIRIICLTADQDSNTNFVKAWHTYKGSVPEEYASMIKTFTDIYEGECFIGTKVLPPCIPKRIKT